MEKSKKERIQKVLAAAGVASRREIERMVLDGRVVVNGKTVWKLPVLIDPSEDRIEVDATPVKLKTSAIQKRYYFLMNKPKGVYCTNVAQGAQKRAIDLLPPDLGARLYPVGQMDADSKGLLILTNDGELTNRLTHPRYGVPKTYRVAVDGKIELEELEFIKRKVGVPRMAIIGRSPTKTVLEITLKEGKNQEIRKVLKEMGHKAREVIRTRIGPIELHALAPGEFREMHPKEIKLLFKDPVKPGKKPGADHASSSPE